MSGINIVIDDSFAHVTYEKNSVSYSKALSVDTLIGSLVSQYGIKLPGLLPPGARYYVKKGMQHHIFLEVPPIPRMIRYTNHGDKVIFEGVVPMPWALFELVCTDGKDGGYDIRGGSVFALKRPLRDDDMLHCFPAANCSSGGSVCWGSTFSRMGPVQSLSDVGRAVDYFFSSEFNTDIHPRLSRYTRYEDMLRDIKDQKTFPADVLVPTGTTFRDLISRL